MLSYRHSFHAGNHADVLKHIVLVELLRYLTAKPRELWYIDTHAGAGTYSPGITPAGRKELESGIVRLWQAPDPPPLVKQYLGLVERLNPSGVLARYPGSPWLANEILRPGDRAWLAELHPADHAILVATLGGNDRRVHIENRDGLAWLKALLPPAPKRGLAMIDPSYERAADYPEVARALADARRRFPGGVYAVWYPMLRSRESREFPRRLKRVAGVKWLHVQLSVRDSREQGMYGSGLLVINPPYTLAAVLDATLRWLEAKLAQGPDAVAVLESSET